MYHGSFSTLSHRSSSVGEKHKKITDEVFTHAVLADGSVTNSPSLESMAGLNPATLTGLDILSSFGCRHSTPLVRFRQMFYIVCTESSGTTPGLAADGVDAGHGTLITLVAQWLAGGRYKEAPSRHFCRFSSSNKQSHPAHYHIQ
ncbi:hypothetical protein PGT21_024639 [Puccinia graminis f. sp. tritici]|uniref:Uncharacterized protein n=1 Tax=Puccinia graminis f. sp. tritici TaxID=56615 RepID=A0A5B0PYV4_PUCGR|nr:hypothetical protein PGT21_024639 [Puccinia graminis f. sp. tritici]KAA1120980.1 hypothetical protein PGTUg99_024600 [Puccinia graminis f. sp. tritici]